MNGLTTGRASSEVLPPTGRASSEVLPPPATHLIVVEGPDGAGKTTLARKLAEDLHLEYHHEGPPPGGVSALEHYARLLDGARGRRVIFDRLALGELVYGPLLRGQDRVGEEGWRVLCRVFAAVGARHVVCLPPPAAAHGAWSSNLRDELFSGDARFYTTYAVFAYLARTFGLRTHDYTRETYEDLLLELSVSQFVLPPGYAGSPFARVLLVGEQVANAQPTSLDLPFVSLEGSSSYLHQALALAGYTDLDVALTNALHLDGTQRRIFLGRFGEVVALGRTAEKVLTAQGVPHRFAPHPQYWKRFHHHDLAGYARLLRGYKR